MLKAKITHFPLNFIKPAGTSRGILHTKNSWILTLSDGCNEGYGEFSIIETLSPDWRKDYPKTLIEIAEQINEGIGIDELIQKHKVKPSIVFALETAQLDLKHGGQRKLFQTDFYTGKQQIPINGLIWMNDADTMRQSIEDKLKEGFDCIKLKIGAIEYQEELKLLKSIRASFSKAEIEIRVDANGAFSPDEATNILEDLYSLDIHSIEQPIKQGQIKEMAELCHITPTPIALDEELIGIHDKKKKSALLDQIQPQYIILKPSLHGGISGSTEWINLAEERNIGWWITSALESNIGLNCICQFASSFRTKMYQGLGTGGLYQNNIKSPLTVQKGHIFYNPNKEWIIPSDISYKSF